MVNLTPIAAAFLGLNHQAQEEEVRVKVDGLASTNFDGLFASPESRDCFLSCLFISKKIEHIEEFPIQADLVLQRKWSISVNGQEFFEVLVFPTNQIAPTLDAEEWIFHLFLNGHFHDLADWRQSLEGKGLTLSHVGKNVSEKERKLCNTLAMGILERSFMHGASPLTTAKVINLKSESTLHTAPSAYELLAESLRETNPKWRFLSFYRTVEHIYVASVLKQLTESFYGGPKDAVENASKSLAAEVEQLRLVVEDNNLTDQFSDFADVFDAVAQRGDQLAIAIQRQMRSKSKQQDEKNNVPKKWNVGVRYCYQVRCAIAHAGQATAFVEKYPDWRKTVDKLCPLLETAVLHLFGVELIS